MGLPDYSKDVLAMMRKLGNDTRSYDPLLRAMLLDSRGALTEELVDSLGLKVFDLMCMKPRTEKTVVIS